MKCHKSIVSVIMILLSVLHISCDKSNLPGNKEANSALINAGNLLVYADPRAAKKSDIKFMQWEEVLCLNPVSPTNIEITDAKTKTTIKKPFYKIKKMADTQINWIEKDSLTFRTAQPIEAVIIKEECYLFSEPKEKKGTDIIPLGEKLMLTGYTLDYNWQKKKIVKFQRVRFMEKIYWVIDDYTITDAFVGIMLEDAKLFKWNKEIPENEMNETYKMMDIVIVLDKGAEGWIKVIKGSKDKEYYMLAKSSPLVSYSEDDFIIARYCKDAYNKAMAIINLVNRAHQQDNVDAALKSIPDKAQKIKTLDASEVSMRRKLADYSNSSFKDIFIKIFREIKEVRIILESESRKESASSDPDSDIGVQNENVMQIIAPIDEE